MILDTKTALGLLAADMEIYLLLLPLVRDQASIDLIEIDKALEIKDIELALNVNHKLKGNLSQIGAAEAHYASKKFEVECKNNGLYVDAYKLLKNEVNILIPIINTYISEHLDGK